MKTLWSFVALIVVLFIACILTGCAQMGTRQLDASTTTRYETTETGQTNAIVVETRETTTKSTGRAVLSGKSTFEGLDATQNGQSQGLKVKKAAQQSDSLTQLVDAMRIGSQIGAMMYGIPPMPSSASVPASASQTRPAVVLQTPPPGQKWILAPIDAPSQPQLETD